MFYYVCFAFLAIFIHSNHSLVNLLFAAWSFDECVFAHTFLFSFSFFYSAFLFSLIFKVILSHFTYCRAHLFRFVKSLSILRSRTKPNRIFFYEKLHTHTANFFESLQIFDVSVVFFTIFAIDDMITSKITFSAKESPHRIRTREDQMKE